MDFLPHLKEHLAGIRIEPPVEALAKWLPKAKSESDRVILLYCGSAAVAANPRPIRRRLTAILVGGIRGESAAESQRRSSGPAIMAGIWPSHPLSEVWSPESWISQVISWPIEPLSNRARNEKVLSKYTGRDGESIVSIERLEPADRFTSLADRWYSWPLYAAAGLGIVVAVVILFLPAALSFSAGWPLVALSSLVVHIGLVLGISLDVRPSELLLANG